MKVPADSISDESPPLGLQSATFSLCTHMAERKKRMSSLVFFSSKGTNSIRSGPHPDDLI